MKKISIITIFLIIILNNNLIKCSIINKSIFDKICYQQQQLKTIQNKNNCSNYSDYTYTCGQNFCSKDEISCKKFNFKKSYQKSISQIKECLTKEEISKLGEKPFYGNDICQNCIDWPNMSDIDGIKYKYKYKDIKIDCKFKSCNNTRIYNYDCDHFCAFDQESCNKLNSMWKLKTAFYRFKKC